MSIETICGIGIAAICFGFIAVVDYVFGSRERINARTGRRER